MVTDFFKPQEAWCAATSSTGKAEECGTSHRLSSLLLRFSVSWLGLAGLDSQAPLTLSTLLFSLLLSDWNSSKAGLSRQAFKLRPSNRMNE